MDTDFRFKNLQGSSKSRFAVTGDSAADSFDSADGFLNRISIVGSFPIGKQQQRGVQVCSYTSNRASDSGVDLGNFAVICNFYDEVVDESIAGVLLAEYVV